MQRRNTIQKELVLKAVQDLRSHVTAEEVYEFIRKSHPGIGKGTVYRNLGILTEEGAVRRVEVPNGADRFDGNIVHHNHAVCSCCGRMFDIMVPLPDVCAAANAQHEIYVDGVSMLFSGICARCAPTQRNEYR